MPKAPRALTRRLSVLAARKHGVGPELLPLISSDPEVFEAFYREHVDDVQRFVARRIGDRERAAELTAEIFLAAIDGAPGYRARKGVPRAWLFGIARIVVAGEGRARARSRLTEKRLRGALQLSEDDSARLDARIDAAAQSRELHEAVARLPDGERAVLELVAVDELTVAEAAAAAGLRPVAARMRLHRARRKLRTELEAATPEPNPNREDEP